MMKSSLIILLVSLCYFGKAQENGFAYSREISGVKNQWHRVMIPDDLFSKVSPGFGDLRFFGITTSNDTIEAPYQIRYTSTEVNEYQVSYKFVDLVKTARGFEYTFLFNGPEAINQINLEFSEENYDWEITVEGSNDRSTWKTVVEDYRLLKIKNEYAKYAFDRIDFNEAKYPYVRITLPLSANPMVISPKMVKRTVVEGKKKNYAVENIVVQQDKVKKQTTIHFELPHAVPVSIVALKMKEQFDYYRPIQISCVHDSIVTEKGVNYIYRDVYHGTLSSLEKNQFDCSNMTAKKIRITIENGDNQPLHLDDVTVNGYVYEAIVRFSDPATYSMVYGNASVYPPNYDIAHFMDRVPKNLETVKLGNEISHGIDEETTSSEPYFKSNWWLYGIMGVVVLLLGWFTLKMMRKEGV